jgi:WD40 repeat protein
MKEIANILAHDNYILGVVFARDGRSILSSGMDKRVMVWSVPDFSLSHSFQAHQNSVNGMSLSPDGTMLATGSTDTTVRVWHLPDFSLRCTLQDRRKVVSVVRISPSGKAVASGSYGGRVSLWTLSGEPMNAWQTPHKNIAGLAFSPDGLTLAVCGLGDTITLWNILTGSVTEYLVGHETAILGVRFIHGGNLLVSHGYDQTVKFWDLQSDQPLRSYSFTGSNGSTPKTSRGLRGLAFSADEQTVAVSLEGKVQLRRTSDWELLGELPVGTNVINGMAFSPDGALLALGCADRKMRIWELD